MTPQNGIELDIDPHRRLAALEAEIARLRAALAAAGLRTSGAQAATALAQDATRQVVTDAADASADHARDMEAGRANLADADALNARLLDLNAELRASEERLEAVVESATDSAIIEMNFEGRITGWSSGAERVFGWTAAEAIGQDGAIIWTPEDRIVGEPARERRAADEIGSAAGDRWHLKRDGTRIWGSGHLTPLRNGRPRGYLKVLRDRTAERRAQETIRASEARYRALFESMDEAYAVVEVLRDVNGAWSDFLFLEVNPAFMAHTSMPDPVGKTASELLGTPNPRWTQLYGQALDTNVPLRVQEAEPTLGRVFDLNIFNLDRARNRVAVLFTDITQRVRAEAALRESEARHRLLIENWAQATWETDADGLVIADSPSWRAYTGQTVEEWLGYGWLDAIHPDDRAYAERQWREEIAARGLVNAEFRLRLPDGNWRWTNVRAAPVLDAGGSIEKWVGMNIDIDARRQAEAALRESEKRYRELFEFMHEGSCIIDVVFEGGKAVDYVFVAVNPAFERHTGIADAEGRRMREIAPDHEEHWFQVYGEVALTGRAKRFDAPAGQLGDRWFDVFAFRFGEPQQRRVAIIFSDVTQQRRDAAALRESEGRFRGFAENSADVLWIANRTGERLDYLSPAFERTFGTPRENLMADLRRWRDLVHPEDREHAQSFMPRALAGEVAIAHYRVVRPVDGRVVHLRDTGFPIRDAATGAILQIAGIVQDVTDMIRSREELEREVAMRTSELMAAEASLRQAQKMEAVGQLTAGIAHDFNNMLQGIAGGLELLRRRAEQGRLTDTIRYAERARETVDRAGALTHRLLAFSRQQTLAPVPVNLDELVEGMAEMIRRTVGPAIQVEVRLGDGRWPVLCDPSQLENALLNLCVNARDAMPDGGWLTILTGEAQLSAADLAGEADLAAGAYGTISVTDAGTGMPPEVVARVFEPFYTTKPLGQGTGLGLSQVYGFVRQSGGFVRIESMPGQGTTVRLFLPCHVATDETSDNEAAMADVVLLVEDEPGLRAMAVEWLHDAGYRVLEAADGAPALRLLHGGGRVDILVTDVGLPGGMNGRQVADAARLERPNLPVLFITGYAGTALRATLPQDMAVIDKPFALDELVTRIRNMLDSR